MYSEVIFNPPAAAAAAAAAAQSGGGECWSRGLCEYGLAAVARACTGLEALRHPLPPAHVDSDERYHRSRQK